MNHYPRWRYILLIILIAVGVVYALPNLYGDDYAIQLSARNSMAIPVNFSANVTTALKKHHAAFLSIENEPRDVLIRFAASSDQNQAKDLLQALYNKQYSVALNLAPRTPQWLQDIGAQPMRLGLDLRGGVNFLLYVNLPGMLKDRFTQDVHSMSADMRAVLIRYAGISQQPGKNINIKFHTENDANKAQKLLSKKFTDYDFNVVKQVPFYVLQASLSPQSITTISQYAMSQNIMTLRNKVNELGVSEPEIQQQGKNYISVNLPGIQDIARAKAMIGKVATIRLQLVDTQHDAIQAANTGIIPFGDTLYQAPNGQPVLVKNQVVLSGRSITNATTGLDENGRPSVNISCSGSEVTQFYQITGANVGKPLATVYVETVTDKKLVNGKVQIQSRQVAKLIQVATIQSALGNSFQITGMRSAQAAKDLALQLRSGAYTAPVSYASSRIIGPSLGQQNINNGVLSCEVGSLIVIIFMMLYYRVFGFIADLALILNVVFIVAIMSILGATMTLPGIAAIVLTVGMAVDANVLINERIREELRLGMTPQAAIAAGYDRAFATIVDANVTTLIVAVVLFALGTGEVKGFAVTLIIGLLTSMVTAIFFTRAIVNLAFGKRQIEHLPLGIKVKRGK